MENVLQRLPSGARVAVVRLRSLGDCVLTTPALEILKQSRPDLATAVVVEDRFAPVFEANPDVDTLLPPSIQALRSWRPQLCLNLHGGTRSQFLTTLSGAEMRAGFAHFRGASLYNLPIPTAQEILGVDRKVHTVEHLVSAVVYLGAARTQIPRAKLFAAPRVSEKPYAVIHPLATSDGKSWPAKGFLAVARHLKHVFDLEPFFIAGAGEDLGPFQEYRCIVGAPLAEVKALLAGAALFAGNDSGPAHMAAAFGIPVLVIFGSSDPVIWGPWKAVSQVIVARDSIESVETAEVLEALERLRVTA
jgi:ADP-heptose:LPS heptosyltransferase